VRSLLLLIALAGDWGELHDSHVRVSPGKPPTANQRKEELDEMQSVLSAWQRERHEFTRDAHESEKKKEAPPPEEAVEPKKVIEVGKPQKKGAPSRYGKIIEVAPDRTEIEQELDSAEERAEKTRQKKAADPKGFAREKAQKEALEKGNDAWDDALEKRWKVREAEIEAEARKIQAELDAARRREALEQAKKMGGTLDAEGNFVDPEIK
jgi:hypothetical protein